jgi:hypothetical protein
MSLGGVPKLERCKEKPAVIIYEVEPSKKDGQTGSMSLCKNCLAKFNQAYPPGFARVEAV